MDPARVPVTLANTAPDTAPDPEKRDGLWQALLLSVAAHLALAGWLSTGFDHTRPAHQPIDSTISMRLVKSQRPEDRVINSRPLTDATPKLESAAHPPPKTTAESTASAAIPDPENDARQADPPGPERLAEPAKQHPSGIAARLLRQIENSTDRLAKSSARKQRESALSRRMPTLPGGHGWLSGYVGAVQPSQESWKSPGGSRQTRTVLADGRVICTRIAAPTMLDVAYAWKSTRVAMSRSCGREQPPAAEPNPLGYRPPPTSLAGSHRR